MLIGRIDSRPDDLERPVHPGAWHVQWMKPEPMHAIEVVEKFQSGAVFPDGALSLRIEIKCRPVTAEMNRAPSIL
jgi:hypothetical protein